MGYLRGLTLLALAAAGSANLCSEQETCQCLMGSPTFDGHQGTCDTHEGRQNFNSAVIREMHVGLCQVGHSILSCADRCNVDSTNFRNALSNGGCQLP